VTTDASVIRNHAAFIWSVADLLRGAYKRADYGKVFPVDGDPSFGGRRGSVVTDLAGIVTDFAESFQEADAARPVWISRSGRTYQPGLGPHAEDAAVRLTLACATAAGRFGGGPAGQSLPYPGASREKADLWIGDPPEWVIEVKMARFFGDNGKPDDTAIKDLLSPYESDRSASPTS